MNFEPLLDPPQHLFMPIDLQVWMQAALHQHASATQFNGLTDFVVDSLETENVSLFGLGSLQRTIKRAKRAVLGAEIRVIDVAVDDVGGNTLRVQSASHCVGFHANADEIVGTVEVKGLSRGKR